MATFCQRDNNHLRTTKGKKETGFFLFSPWVVFSIIGVGLIALSVRDVIRKKRTKSVDVLIFVITGLVGVVIAILWFASDHYATKLNYNILWAFPISLISEESVV